MKLVRCEWAPSLVVEWLCGELEERGIPGPTYAHTLLSLLHHHYCPHPAPSTPIAATACSFSSSNSRYHHPLSRRHLDDFDLRDLDLDDLLGHTTHPDADLPDLSAFTPQQRGGSRRARKRYKVRQKQRILTSEQLQKVAALQCLMSASDERYDLESLVEELCSRLKTAAEDEHLNTSNSISSASTKKDNSVVSVNLGSHESSNDTDGYTSSSTPEEQAEKYYAAFPPLSGKCQENCLLGEPCKSGNVLCSCVREVNKSSVNEHSQVIQNSICKMPRTHRKKCREKERKKDGEAKPEGPDCRELPRRHHHVSFTWHAATKHKKDKLSENYDTDSASEPERTVERRRKKYLGPLLDEDIGEGYIGDTSSRESSEDRDKGDQDLDKSKDEKMEKNSGPSTVEKVKITQEEWECMGDLLMGASNPKPEPLQGVGVGGRLFERGSTSGGTSVSSSDVETFPYSGLDQEAESVRQLERKISDTVAQVWGQPEPLGQGRGEHVWDPPAMQEIALYTTVWDLNISENFGSQDPVVDEQGNCDQKIIQRPQTPVSDRWYQSKSWHSNHGNQDGPPPMFCSLSSQSPHSLLNDNSGKEASALLQLTSSLEKSIWSDCNANNISGEDTLSAYVDDPMMNNVLDVYQEDEKCERTDVLESKLCESFMKLGIESLWESTLGLESVFADYNLSNNNVEYPCVSENTSFEEVIHDNPADSDHEKMMALVEDVCKSYESQEESTDSSVIKQVPSGPSGPQADLGHTENSGFSMVIPRGKSADPNSSLDQLSESLIVGLENSCISRSGTQGSMDMLPPAQEEENLLTSPRTHFRPIRQESVGSTADDNYEDGTMFIINSERPDLPFQRTSSGALFLESDMLEGSPKKYMVYKEPVPKVTQTEEEPEVATNENYAVIALVPKFKVVNNEKFCQTEEEGLSVDLRSKAVCKEKARSFEKVNLEDHFTFHDDDQEPDVFEFQHQDFPDNNNLASIWKSGPQGPEKTYTRNIWQIAVERDRKDSWSRLNEHEGGAAASSWLEQDVDGSTGWSSESHFEPTSKLVRNEKSEAVVIPNSLASLWRFNSPPASPDFSASIPNLQALWAGLNSKAQSHESEADGGRTNMYVITNPTTHIPGKFHENYHGMSVNESSSWKLAKSRSREKGENSRWSENSLFTSHHLHARIGEKSSVCGENNMEASGPGIYTELRLEVDQEADELLGALHAQTASDFAHSQSLLDGRHALLPEQYSPQPLHERLKKTSSGNPVSKTVSLGTQITKEKGDLQEQEREDLDDLAPGWELNDGFEWETQTHGADEGEEGPDGIGFEEVGEGEVLVYETEDGTTYTIPVEYLDDTLYDQIFGAADSENPRLGGSLPDLPTGHPTSIRFSSDLEDEWKKSGIPYKVQLPRKPRPGRWLPPSRRPCTFFMEGSCRRSDCKFSHDLASITCRFWEEGSCLKGITCPFLHGYPLRRRRNKSEGAAHSEGEKPDHHHSSSFEIDSEMDFPTLGSSCDSKASSVDERNFLASNMSSSSSSSHPTVARKKKRKFITITKNVLGEVKSAEAERALRRRAALKRERRRRHTDTTSATTDIHAASTATDSTQRNPKTNRKKAERHRASASGHVDGTMSDY